jgi:stringent starvation protein B
MMTSTRPYLIRAFYDWIVDNDCNPYIVINANVEGVNVPEEYIEGGQIVLNIAVSAVNGLVLGDHAIEFQARFGGKIRQVYAPILAIVAIYAKENGRGMVFAEDEEEETLPPAPPPTSHTPGDKDKGKSKDKGKLGNKKGGNAGKGHPHLTVIK